MTDNSKQIIPAATTPVEEIAAHIRITPNNLRLAIGLAAAAGYTVDLMIELVRLRVAARMRCRIVPAEWPASKSTINT